MEYYRMIDDIGVKDRWYLGDFKIDIEDVWKLNSGQPVDLSRYNNLKIEFDQKGMPLDFTETDGVNIPIVSEAFAECIYEFIGEIDLIPIFIPDAKGRYYVLVVKNLVDCVDEQKSDFKKFQENDDIRPDLAGEYSVIRSLKIDKSKVNKNIFRLEKYDLAVIINETIKKSLHNKGLLGVKFISVS